MSRRPSRTLVAGLILAATLSAGTAAAYTLEEFTFDDPAKSHEFRDLISGLRCLVCQNESLAASQAGVAEDLRKEIYAMMKDGKSQEEIVDFLVARYGDFVLYEPPIKPSTYLLWFGPFIFVATGAFFLLRTLQRKKAEPEQDLTEADRERLRRLLDDDKDKKD